MKIVSVSNPTYLDAGRTAVNVTVRFDAFDAPLPFTVTPEDETAHGKELYRRFAAGELGPIAAAPRHLEAETAAHAAALKVRAANADRTGALLPETGEGVREARDASHERAAALNMAAMLHTVDAANPPLTAGEQAEAKRLQGVLRYWRAVDDAARDILASGAAAEPIGADPRWPAPPAR